MSDLTLCARHVKTFPYCERCKWSKSQHELGAWFDKPWFLPATDPASGDCLEFVEVG